LSDETDAIQRGKGKKLNALRKWESMQLKLDEMGRWHSLVHPALLHSKSSKRIENAGMGLDITQQYKATEGPQTAQQKTANGQGTEERSDGWRSDTNWTQCRPQLEGQHRTAKQSQADRT